MNYSVFPGSLCKAFLTPLNLQSQELSRIITALGQPSLGLSGRGGRMWRGGDEGEGAV